VTIRIKKGRHRPGFWTVLRTLGITWEDRMHREVIFSHASKYDHPGIEDDQDVNKLFGFGFWPGHHTHSARVGWWYDASIGKFILMAYVYIAGQRITEKLCECLFNHRYQVTIFNNRGLYQFYVKNEFDEKAGYWDIRHGHGKRFAYLPGHYFGGNNVAPNEIEYECKKIKLPYTGS